MKKGDLVELSSYGRKIKMLERYKGGIGLVLSYHFHGAYVHWTNAGIANHVNRRDIKKIKAVN